MRTIAILLSALLLSSYASADPGGAGFFQVTSYGAVCDGVTDDSVAIQSALNAAAATCTYDNNALASTPIVAFPAGVVCKVNTGLIRPNCVSIDGNQVTLDLSGLSGSGIGITVTIPSLESSNSQNGSTGIYLDNLHMSGPAQTSVGIQLNAAGGVYRNVDIHNFGTGVAIGNNSYLHLFDNISIANYDVAGFFCPPGLSNAGENERWSGGGIYKGTGGAAAIDNQGCEFNAFGMSIDFPSGPFVRDATGPVQSTASTKLVDFHFERSANTAYPAIDIGGGSTTGAGCNTWSHIILTDGTMINDDAGQPNSLAIVRDDAFPCAAEKGQGAWVIIENVQIAGWRVIGKCKLDAPQDINDTCVLGHNASLVSLQNIANGSGAGMAFLNVGKGR